MKEANKNKLKKLISKLEEIRESIGTVLGSEEETYDAMSETRQESDRGEKSLEDQENLNESVGAIDEVIEYLTNIVEAN